LGQRLAELGFRGAQLIGQAEAALEKAVVDTAQLADEGTPGAARLATRESGHAGDHAEASAGRDIRRASLTERECLLCRSNTRTSVFSDRAKRIRTRSASPPTNTVRCCWWWTVWGDMRRAR